MSSRRARIGWGVALGMLGSICVGASLGRAQQGESPAVETLLPAGAVLYVGFDGNDAHAQAWKQTAAYEALYESGLMDVIQKVFTALIEQAQARGGGKGPDLAGLKQAYELITNKGFSLAVTVRGGGDEPPAASAVLVLHEAAALKDGLQKLIEQAPPEARFETRELNGRRVTGGLIPNSPGIELGWWTEGEHLLIAAGMQALESATAVAAGSAENISTNPLWKKYKAEPAGFETALVGWLDMGSLRQMFGAMPIPGRGAAEEPLTVNRILETAGLDTVGAVVCRSGYKGRATWTETLVEAPAPRKGLLALADQPPITMRDLPPLPFGTDGFYASSVNWAKSYDGMVELLRAAAALGPPDAAAQLDGLLSQLPERLGFDVKADLFEALGNVGCLYGDTRQGLFGMGAGLVLEVRDAAKLRRTLEGIAGTIAEEAGPNDLVVSRSERQGRQVVTFQIRNAPVMPAYAVDDQWLVIGLYPQTVEAFLLRVDGKLTLWEPTPSYAEALRELPQQFTSIAASDPRKTYRLLLGLAPVALSYGQQAAREKGFELPVSIADIPPAEQVARPLFPNLSVTTVDDEGIRFTSRTSLPSVPLLGGMNAAAALPVAAALLLPAVQQARSAARRAHSMNNLKQIGLALHNYHDTNGAFPAGTVPNEDLKTEERLSWMYELLPFLEQAPLYRQIDRDRGWQDEANSRFTKTKLPVFQNPGTAVQGNEDFGTTHYVGIAGVGEDAPTRPATDKRAGVFGENRKTRIADIIDGTSNTIMVSEASGNFGPWSAGGKATIRALTRKPYINGPDGIGGPYDRGCCVLFCDGSVRFLSEDTDPGVLEALATTRGLEVVRLP